MLLPGRKLTAGRLHRPFPLRINALPSRNLAGLFFLLWGLGFACILPALADGGGTLPTSTPIPSTPLPATSLPLGFSTSTPNPGQVYPAPVSGTAEVKSFEIVIDQNQNATIQAVTPANQAALSRAEALEAQGNAPAAQEKFVSPLWIFGFITLVIIIAMMNAASKGLRKKA
jgi:hypothetical protein